MKYLFFLSALLFTGFSSSAQTVGLIQHHAQSLDDGYVLFAPIARTNTYLIDKCGKQVKTWNSSYRPGQSVYLMPDGNLLRTGNANNTTFNAGGRGGILEILDWNNNVVWSYVISDSLKCQHHDAKLLPNGNILVIAWESKTNAEAIARGRNPSLVPATLWSEQILEIQPTGSNGGTVVWEWHAWDHLVQDLDSTKPDYGIVASNPQLINLNYGASFTQSDWLHLNSIDYNPVLDQIIVSSHEMDEIWIIDHSTTTAEAASHSGGNSGKGGDLLYRWGNPAAYNNGTVADQKFFGQHNARWIESGFPYAGQIMVFNNGLNRPGGNYSTVEIINTPVAGYNYTSTLPYLPAMFSWIYNAGNPNNYYAQNVSGAQMLPNGNVLMCNGPAGNFSETDSLGNIVWEYINPVSSTGIISQNTAPTQNSVFRCSFYPSDFSGFASHTLTSGNTIENTNPVSASCILNLPTSAEGVLTKAGITVSPNPFANYIRTSGINETAFFRITNLYGQIVWAGNQPEQEDFSHLKTGVYFLTVFTEMDRYTIKLIRD